MVSITSAKTALRKKKALLKSLEKRIVLNETSLSNSKWYEREDPLIDTIQNLKIQRDEALVDVGMYQSLVESLS